MMRHVTIIAMLFLGIPLVWGAEKKLVVNCGDWIELSATPYQNYHFVRWNDGDTTAVRQIQVNEDSHYIAFFASDCAPNPEVPMLELYDWLLMLDVRAIHSMGYHFGEQHVKWYRVVDTPDDVMDVFPQDDELVCQGYYLTIDRNLWTTGDYYAVVDVSATPSLELCNTYMRTHIAHFAGTKSRQRLSLTPTHVMPRQQMQLVGLDPLVQSTICVYDMVGRLLTKVTSQNEVVCYLQAATIPGCYNVVVRWEDEKQILRYLVHNQ